MTQNIWELNLTSLTRTITANCGTHGIYLARCKTRSWIRSTSLARFCTITDPWYRLQDTALILHLPHLPSPSISARTRAVSAAEPSSRQFNDRRRGKYLNVCTTIFLQFRGKNCSENTQGCNVSWASQLRGPHYGHYSLHSVSTLSTECASSGSRIFVIIKLWYIRSISSLAR